MADEGVGSSVNHSLLALDFHNLRSEGVHAKRPEDDGKADQEHTDPSSERHPRWRRPEYVKSVRVRANREEPAHNGDHNEQRSQPVGSRLRSRDRGAFPNQSGVGCNEPEASDCAGQKKHPDGEPTPLPTPTSSEGPRGKNNERREDGGLHGQADQKPCHHDESLPPSCCFHMRRVLNTRSSYAGPLGSTSMPREADWSSFHRATHFRRIWWRRRA